MLREAAEVGEWRGRMDRTPVEPWPFCDRLPAVPRGRLRSFLFLQVPYAGGVWEATRDLVKDLVTINREQGQLDLALGIHQKQGDPKEVAAAHGGVVRTSVDEQRQAALELSASGGSVYSSSPAANESAARPSTDRQVAIVGDGQTYHDASHAEKLKGTGNVRIRLMGEAAARQAGFTPCRQCLGAQR